MKIEPFTLREHVAWPKKRASQLPGFESVGTVGADVILRRPANHTEIKPTPAKPLPRAKEIEKQVQADLGTCPALAGALAGIDQLARAGENLFIAEIAKQALAVLTTKARRGDGEALHRFAAIMIEAGEALSQITVANPKAVQPIAEQTIRWPMMRSRNPLNCDSDSLLDTIKLGSKTPINYDRYSKTKPDHAAQVAIDLVAHMQRELPGLPRFTTDTAPKWWAIARKVFLQSYPAPESVAELARIVSTPSRRKSPGRMREQILSKIQARFLAIAPVK